MAGAILASSSASIVTQRTGAILAVLGGAILLVRLASWDRFIERHIADHETSWIVSGIVVTAVATTLIVIGVVRFARRLHGA